ncbi:MAG: glycosyl hydrolase, partial [Gemmatimonadetes bacterium]|nr:glycosyl hydrolase [Gemmatimonadota bacterium]
MRVDPSIRLRDLNSRLDRCIELARSKITSISETWDPCRGAPVYTVGGKYATRGWTEWTQGFQYGCAILLFDALGEKQFLEIGRRGAVDRMAPHVTHTGVHDHGFNNISTYGNLRRLMLEGAIPVDSWEQRFYELALKASGAVQGARWTTIRDGKGYIPSFNGAHSLFSDTIRTCRSLGLAHGLGHVLMVENDRAISLFDRMIEHAETTARYNVYYGDGRDAYDVRGRVAHESIFNVQDGNYRCPSTQQGYSPFSTWTRGLAWIVTGYSELLEFLEVVDDEDLAGCGGRGHVTAFMTRAATAAADYYVAGASAADGIPYWDTGAPGLTQMGDYLGRAADPFNEFEPVDSSAAAIAAQGLYRLGRYLGGTVGGSYTRAALTVARTLFDAPYLSDDENHQGLILHSVYHRP